MPDNVERTFGYRADLENVDHLIQTGMEAEQVLHLARAAYPEHNPYIAPWTWLKWQGGQGACQGHSLSQVPQIGCTQQFGIQMVFSRAQAYYESQKIGGINGDRGSTLADGQKLITQTGICLERDWPYPSRYNNRRPAGYENFPKAKMRASQPVRDPQLAWDLLHAGAVIQTGITWNNSCEPEVCDRYSSGGAGGHSTYLFGLDRDTENAIHNNSWQNWNGDGRNQWTQGFFGDILSKDRWAVFIAYLPADIDVNPLPPINELHV